MEEQRCEKDPTAVDRGPRVLAGDVRGRDHRADRARRLPRAGLPRPLDRRRPRRVDRPTGRSPADGTLVRVHSECLTGEAFGSLKCECGPQLQSALDTIEAEGGVVIYLRGHEGRGIGLINKLQGLPPAGGRLRHPRRQPRARPARRRPRLRGRHRHPEGPRHLAGAAAQQQPREGAPARGARRDRHRPGAAGRRRRRVQRGLPRRQARPHGPRPAEARRARMPRSSRRSSRTRGPPHERRRPARARHRRHRPEGDDRLRPLAHPHLRGPARRRPARARRVGCRGRPLVQVPGSFELPVAAKVALENGRGCGGRARRDRARRDPALRLRRRRRDRRAHPRRPRHRQAGRLRRAHARRRAAGARPGGAAGVEGGRGAPRGRGRARDRASS